MTWQIFGPFGYLSIILSVAAVACWLTFWAKHARLWVNIGFLLALFALIAGRINSSGHVSRIDVDPSAKIAELEARQKAKEQALINNRSEEVAQIRFAEDGEGDFLDTAGMDETDLKYMKAITEAETPDWKKDKRQRGSTSEEDESLEGMIEGEEASDGADVSELEEQQKADPIFLEESTVVLANQLDFWNLRLTTILFWIGIILLVIDYLRRANLYQEASKPIPLPSFFLNALNPLPVVRNRPQSPRRDMTEELKWLVQRGDSFIYFNDHPEHAKQVIESLKKLEGWPHKLDLIQVDDNPLINSHFIFESLWYGRASFLVNSPAQAQELLVHFAYWLEKRCEKKAQTAQSVHLVWDIEDPIPDDSLKYFKQWATPSGYSLFLNSNRTS